MRNAERNAARLFRTRRIFRRCRVTFRRLIYGARLRPVPRYKSRRLRRTAAGWTRAISYRRAASTSSQRRRGVPPSKIRPLPSAPCFSSNDIAALSLPEARARPARYKYISLLSRDSKVAPRKPSSHLGVEWDSRTKRRGANRTFERSYRIFFRLA